MTRRWVYGKHLGFRDDSEYKDWSTEFTDLGYGGSSIASSDYGYGGSSTASSDLGYGGSSTAATSTRSPLHLVERYQKMSMHPHAAGKLRYARLVYQGLLTLLSACAGPSLSQTKLISEKVEETKHQESKVNANSFSHMSLFTIHHVTCDFFFPTMQVPSQPAREDSATVKGECKVNSGGQEWEESTDHLLPLNPQLLRPFWMTSPGSLLASSHSRLDQ